MHTRRELLALMGSVTALFTLALVLNGCGGEKKMARVPVGEMEDYKDPGIGFSIQHPKGWTSNIPRAWEPMARKSPWIFSNPLIRRDA
jgi:hypothetical protein